MKRIGADRRTEGSGWRRSIAVAAVLLAALPAAAAAQRSDAQAATFTNPVLPSGPDPWVTEHEGVFYYTHTLGNRIALWRTRDVTQLASAEQRVVWTASGKGPNAHAIWAPELHRIDGRWYLYYSATVEGFRDDQHRGIFVLENAGSDPFAGEWVDRGRVNTARAGIDGTVFEHGGAWYFAYSPYIGPVSGLAIARMANPWTLAGPERVIAEPDRPWEDRGGRRILEGPQFLRSPAGDVFMTYSAGACWSDDYALGLLRAGRDGDLLDRATWTKGAAPVLKSGNGVFATGHNGFFRSPDEREQWIVFHANPGPKMGCTSKRAPHLARVKWRKGGEPYFDAPLAAGTQLPKPSGTARN